MGLFSRRSTTPDPVPPVTGNRWEALVQDECVQRSEDEPASSRSAGTRVPAGGRPMAVAPRTWRVSMSLTEAEHQAWAEAAGGQRLSVWARERVQEQLEADTPWASEAQEWAKIRADLARVGSNLNQLMRAVNQGQIVPVPQLHEAVDALAKELGAVRRMLP